MVAVAVLAAGYGTAQAYAGPVSGSCGNVTVTNAGELSAAAGNACAHDIGVRGVISSPKAITLAPGQRLTGTTNDAAIVFPKAVDGVQLSSDNTVSKLRIQADSAQRAIFNDTNASGLGTVTLSHVTTTGQVQLLAQGRVRSGHVAVDGLDIVAADTSSQPRPSYTFYGGPLESRQGAFQIWNRQPDASSVVTADLRGITVGRPNAPVLGSGVAVFGATGLTVPTPDNAPVGDVLHQLSQHPHSGSVRVSTIDTGALYTDGGLTPVDPSNGNAIVGSAAVLVGAQAPVQTLHVGGQITTTGLTAGATDIFSDVGSMTYDGSVETFGPTGIAIVTWPRIGTLTTKAAVTTHGVGSRGLNAYAGHIDTVRMHDIHTEGAGAPAIDIFASINDLGIDGNVETTGVPGPSLVLGHYTVVPSDALRVAEGGTVDSAHVSGTVSTTAPGTAAVLVGQNSRIGTLCVGKGIQATGLGSQPVDNTGTLTLKCPAPSH
ncbi:hypothetical protein K7711_43575 [Nocardia sp. CA2R105]|uniref:hypothetical protein n=1 Tax=Nocardia coffeae TaxID=2873381 RepID=UPI001CA65874|nr:hypothetical protein [Nocardia coffeae]MBY8863412.1 hypothetical protein [Nocardia coffeae]